MIYLGEIALAKKSNLNEICFESIACSSIAGIGNRLGYEGILVNFFRSRMVIEPSLMSM